MTARRSGSAGAATASWTSRDATMAQQTAQAARPEGRYVSRIRQAYQKEVVRQMMERYGYKNPMAVPRLHKIVVNMGVGEASVNIKILDAALEQLGAISGQRPVM